MNHLYTIRDEATEGYGQILQTRAQGEAVRMFMDEATNKESRINKHPNDFALYKLGTYDDQTGEITAQKPERIARATDFIGEEK